MQPDFFTDVRQNVRHLGNAPRRFATAMQDATGDGEILEILICRAWAIRSGVHARKTSASLCTQYALPHPTARRSHGSLGAKAEVRFNVMTGEHRQARKWHREWQAFSSMPSPIREVERSSF